MSQERMDEIQLVKEEVRNKNVDAIADLLVKMQNELQRVSNENVELKHMVSQIHQKNAEQDGQISALKTMGFRGNMGTGSTVHFKHE